MLAKAPIGALVFLAALGLWACDPATSVRITNDLSESVVIQNTLVSADRATIRPGETAKLGLLDVDEHEAEYRVSATTGDVLGCLYLSITKAEEGGTVRLKVSDLEPCRRG